MSTQPRILDRRRPGREPGDPAPACSSRRATRSRRPRTARRRSSARWPTRPTSSSWTSPCRASTAFEACRRLKADERTHLVPIVLVTGLVAREDRIEGIAAGCDDFLTKPVDSEQLIARTRSLLRAKALVDELEQAENVLVSLATALDAKDNYTRGHSERVAAYAEALGGAARPRPRASGATSGAPACCTTSARSAPRSITCSKPGPLTTAEYEEVKQHPVIGYEICRPLRTMAPLLAPDPRPPRAPRRPRLSRRPRRPTPSPCPCAASPSPTSTTPSPPTARTARRCRREEACSIMREEASVGMWDLRLVDALRTRGRPPRLAHVRAPAPQTRTDDRMSRPTRPTPSRSARSGRSHRSRCIRSSVSLVSVCRRSRCGKVEESVEYS